MSLPIPHGSPTPTGLSSRERLPRISVLISTYASRRFVRKKLAEILAQTAFEECEFIFIETGSPERERELLQPFCQSHPNCRLIATEERKSLYEAWNLGWTHARAPLLCYSNMDDTMHPRLLEEVVDAMEQRQWDACSVLIAIQPYEDPHLDTWRTPRLRTLKLSRRPGPFTAWRADLAERIGRFDDQFFGAGDLDFWSRINQQHLRVGLIRKVLYLFTDRPDQLSKSVEHAERRQHDKHLLAQKPYPAHWPPRIWREVLFWRGVLRWIPSLALRELPDNATSHT